MAKGDREYFERLLRSCWERQTVLLAKGRTLPAKVKFDLAITLGLATAVLTLLLSIWVWISPPAWYAIVSFVIVIFLISIYPFLHFAAWLASTLPLVTHKVYVRAMFALWMSSLALGTWAFTPRVVPLKVTITKKYLALVQPLCKGYEIFMAPEGITKHSMENRTLASVHFHIRFPEIVKDMRAKVGGGEMPGMAFFDKDSGCQFYDTPKTDTLNATVKFDSTNNELYFEAQSIDEFVVITLLTDDSAKNVLWNHEITLPATLEEYGSYKYNEIDPFREITFAITKPDEWPRRPPI
jgi:hypothetical protein